MDQYTVFQVEDMRAGEVLLLQARQFKKLRPGVGTRGEPVFKGAIDDGIVPFMGVTWLRRVDDSKQREALRRAKSLAKQEAFLADKRIKRRYGFKVRGSCVSV